MNVCADAWLDFSIDSLYGCLRACFCLCVDVRFSVFTIKKDVHQYIELCICIRALRRVRLSHNCSSPLFVFNMRSVEASCQHLHLFIVLSFAEYLTYHPHHLLNHTHPRPHSPTPHTPTLKVHHHGHVPHCSTPQPPNHPNPCQPLGAECAARQGHHHRLRRLRGHGEAAAGPLCACVL